MPHESRITPWSAFDGYSFVAVRIWTRKTPFGVFQRHEWRRADGSKELERWIPNAMRNLSPKDLPNPEDTDDTAIERMRAALQKIADGDNDPRTLARMTLELI